MWLYTAQNVVNIPVICSYTGELICPQMPQNEERNISTDSSNRIVHLQEVLPTNFTIFSSFSMIMASIPQQSILVPRIFAALDFPRKNRLTRAWTRVENPKWPHPKSKVGSLSDFFSPIIGAHQTSFREIKLLLLSCVLIIMYFQIFHSVNE